MSNPRKRYIVLTSKRGLKLRVSTKTVVTNHKFITGKHKKLPGEKKKMKKYLGEYLTRIFQWSNKTKAMDKTAVFEHQSIR